jgi:DNA-directed RNA polymerase specialized sigma24 family protein
VGVLAQLSNPRLPLERLLESLADQPDRQLRRPLPSRSAWQRQRRLTDDETEQLVIGYLGGASERELAEQLKLHRTTVMRHLAIQGVAIRSPRKLSEDQVLMTAELYSQGWTLAELGSRFGVNERTVGSSLKRTGITLRPKGRRRRLA